MKLNKFQLFFIFFLLLAVLLLFQDGQNSWQVITHIDYALIITALVFSIADICFDFFCWYFYLNAAEKALLTGKNDTYKKSFKTSVLIFLTGFATDLLPAKMGTFSRPILLKKIQHLPLRFGTAIQFNALFADFTAAAIIAIIGLLSMNYEKNLILLTTIFVFFMVGLFFFAFKVIPLQALIQRLIRPFFPAEAAYGIADLQTATLQLFVPRFLLVTFHSKLVSWFCMGFSLYFILQSLGYELHWSEAIFIVTISAIIGVISMLPGGIGVTDASLVGFLIFMNIPSDIAVFSIFLYRLMSFWLWVLVGNASGQYLLSSDREKNGFS